MVALGRVVEVRGGRGRKDRHSKVHTSKGPKDRRVRLSAVTAIQFYDVQDRLGYERPSEAVDWLMHKAKASIEALPIRPRVSPYSLGVSGFPSFEPQDLGDSAKDPTQTGFKDEFLEAAKEGCHEKLQSLHHVGADSINFLPSYHIDSSTLSSLSNEYVCMEEFINYGFENNTSDPSLMLEEESILCLPPSSSVQLSSNHMQVCSLSKLFQSRERDSTMNAPIWRVDSTQAPVWDLPGIPGTGLPCEECNKQ